MKKESPWSICIFCPYFRSRTNSLPNSQAGSLESLNSLSSIMQEDIKEYPLDNIHHNNKLPQCQSRLRYSSKWLKKLQYPKIEPLEFDIPAYRASGSN